MKTRQAPVNGTNLTSSDTEWSHIGQLRLLALLHLLSETRLDVLSMALRQIPPDTTISMNPLVVKLPSSSSPIPCQVLASCFPKRSLGQASPLPSPPWTGDRKTRPWLYHCIQKGANKPSLFLLGQSFQYSRFVWLRQLSSPS